MMSGECALDSIKEQRHVGRGVAAVGLKVKRTEILPLTVDRPVFSAENTDSIACSGM